MSRFKNWQYPEFDENDKTKWDWRCHDRQLFILGRDTDIACFTVIEAKYGVEIQDDAGIGSHCTIYSWLPELSENERGKVTIRKNARIGTHSVIMPKVTIGENAIVAMFSLVDRDVPDNGYFPEVSG
ncbi:MAG: acyltransferase [Candidatus Bathyarchaeota archaeon]|nr:acyltransferase [Candidatus Bathyarchaeota archaeon]